MNKCLTLLLATLFALPAGLMAQIFSETFETTTLTATETAGTAYSGDEAWRVGDNSESTNDTNWAVNTGLGWTGNDAGSNQYLFADSTGSDTSADSSVFSTTGGLGASSGDILSVKFDFTITLGSNDVGASWGALVMSDTQFNDGTTTPGSADQQVHIRLTNDGKFGDQGSNQLGTETFTVGTAAVNNFELIYNGSASAFDAGDGNIASGRAALYSNGNLVINNFDVGHLGNTDGVVTLDYLEFRAFGSLDNNAGTNGAGPTQAYFDNVNISAIPEPSTLALFGLAGIIIIRRLRRRK